MSRWQYFWQHIILQNLPGEKLPILIMFYGWLIANELMVWMQGIMLGDPMYSFIGALLLVPTVMRAYVHVELVHDIIWLWIQRSRTEIALTEPSECAGDCCGQGACSSQR